MLVLCDFDGTITTTDVTNLIWDELGIPQWRERLLPAYRAGQTSTLELMDTGWKAIRASEADLLAMAHPRIALRDGFDTLRAMCAAKDWPFHVVSCGLDWYIRAFLPPGVPYTSYTATLADGWRVSLPAACHLPPGVDFKIHVMQALQERHPGLPVVFIGDGRNDFPIARAASHAFAVRDSTLAHLSAKHGVPCVEFDSFAEVVSALEAMETVTAQP